MNTWSMLTKIDKTQMFQGCTTDENGPTFSWESPFRDDFLARKNMISIYHKGSPFQISNCRAVEGGGLHTRLTNSDGWIATILFGVTLFILYHVLYGGL